MKENHRRCCGIDVHKNSVTVCVLGPGGQRQMEVKRRKFRTYTRDLKQVRAWLKNCQVTGIAMESTGQYWPERVTQRVSCASFAEGPQTLGLA